jgi:hypothetical protein
MASHCRPVRRTIQLAAAFLAVQLSSCLKNAPRLLVAALEQAQQWSAILLCVPSSCRRGLAYLFLPFGLLCFLGGLCAAADGKAFLEQCSSSSDTEGSNACFNYIVGVVGGMVSGDIAEAREGPYCPSGKRPTNEEIRRIVQNYIRDHSDLGEKSASAIVVAAFRSAFACKDSKSQAAGGRSAQGFLLLVTWLVKNQPSNTTQVTFNSMEACETARLQVMKDAEHMKQEKLQTVTRESQNSADAADARLSAALTAPSVSAVCVAQ